MKHHLHHPPTHLVRELLEARDVAAQLQEGVDVDALEVVEQVAAQRGGMWLQDAKRTASRMLEGRYVRHMKVTRR